METLTKTIEKSEFDQISDTYMSYRRQEALTSMGHPFEEGYSKETFKNDYKIAEEAFNQQISQKVRSEFAEKEKLKKLNIVQKDFSKYTVAQYEELTDLEEKFDCFKAMFNTMNEKIAESVGRAIGARKLKVGGLCKIPQTGCTYEKVAQKMMAHKKYAFVIGSDVNLLESSAFKFVQNQVPIDNEQWENEFKKIQQAGGKIGANLIRFADFCRQKDRECIIGCSNSTQMKALEDIIKKFSFKLDKKSSEIKLTLLDGSQKKKNLADLYATDCAVLVGNVLSNDYNKEIVNAFLKFQTCAVLDLAQNYETDKLVHGYVLQLSKKVKNDSDSIGLLINAYMEHKTGKILSQKRAKAKL